MPWEPWPFPEEGRGPTTPKRGSPGGGIPVRNIRWRRGDAAHIGISYGGNDVKKSWSWIKRAAAMAVMLGMAFVPEARGEDWTYEAYTRAV